MSSHAFRFAIAFLLLQEGGYVADDAGHGPSNFGINSAAHPGVDVKTLTEETAALIYKADYWDAIRLDSLPMRVAVAVFDGAVNHGAVTSVKLLQGALGIPLDGVVGPITEAAAKRPNALEVYGIARALRYAQHPKFQTYGPTWMRRLLQCQSYCEGLPD